MQSTLNVLAIDATITINEPTEFIFTYGDTSSETTYEYDGNANDRITVTSNNENIVKVDVLDNRIIATPVNAGETTITISAPATPQYNAVTKDIAVTVKPKPIVVTWTSGDFTYDGTEKSVSATITNLVSGDAMPTLTYSENIKTYAGNYTAKVETISDSNYTTVGGTNINYNWKIRKAKRTIEITSELTLEYGESGEILFTYDGEDTVASVLSTASTVATALMQDELNGGTVIVGTEGAGRCNIVVTIPATQNYESVEGICEVTVLAAEPELEIADTQIELTYGDAPVSTTYTYSGNGKVVVSVSDSTVVKAKLVGNQIIITPLGATINSVATVTITTAATAQYTETSKEITVIINPRPISVEWNENEFTYDGREKEVVVSNIINLVSGDKIDFTYSGNKEILAGNYVAEIIGITGEDANNYTVTGGQNVTHNFVIKKADREINVQNEISLVYGTNGTVEFKYTGEDVEATVVNSDNNVATITYEDGIKKGTVTITPVGAGESTVTINVPESDNYNAGTKTFKVKVSPTIPELEISNPDVELTYGDNPKEILYNYTGNGEVTVTSSDNNIVTGTATVSTIVITPGNVGTATLTIKTSATPQYESIEATINVTVVPRPIEVRWGITVFIYDGTEKTLTATIRNIVPGDTITIDGYTGNTATEIGTYTATITSISNSNYTLDGGKNLTTTWKIRELLPPDIIVKQGEEIIESGTWASGDVTVTIEEIQINGQDITYEYSYNGEDWIHYSGPFVISREYIDRTIYARAYNSENGMAMSLIGEYNLKLDKTDPGIRATSIETTGGINGIISKDSTITVNITIEDLISGINSADFTAEDIEVILTYKGIATKLTDISKILVADSQNVGLEQGNYKYTLTLSGIKGNGRLDIRIPEKSIYDRALRYNQTTTINLNLTADNEGPEVGIIETSADSYGRIFGDEVELKVEATDNSGIASYEWQYSKDGITWNTFETDTTKAEISEVIYNAINEGAHYFRVIVSDTIGNTSISQTATVNINMTMNRKPTIRFETKQLSATEVKITAIIKSTRAIESIKVNASEFDKALWRDKVVKVNNELTLTIDYIATSNGTYSWTVVDDLANKVTEKINITTIDDTRVVVAYKTFNATEYALAKITFEGNQDMRIVRVEKPNGDVINILKGNECAGMTFSTSKFTRNITVKLEDFEKNTTFVFENKSFIETSVKVTEDIDTNIMYVRIAQGVNLFDTLFGDTFDNQDAELLVKQMLSKTVGINGSIENYYGISNTSMALKVSDQDDLMALEYLASETRNGETLRMNQYGDPEKLKATVAQNGIGTDSNYRSENKTGIMNFGDILNWTGSTIKKTFRITMRAR